MDLDVDMINKAVLSIIAEELVIPLEDLSSASSLIEDLNADSLALSNIVMNVEEKFNVEIPEEDWKSLTTIGDITAYVSQMAGQSMATKTAPVGGS